MFDPAPWRETDIFDVVPPLAHPTDSPIGAPSMPYTTHDDGIRTFSDHDTPPEFATDADEERAAYDHAVEIAFSAAEDLAGLIDGFSAAATSSAAMRALGDKISALVAEVEALAK